MPEFWSIKDVARYLGVEYKTVYRLVRKGEIPAGKVGGVYRIRRADVDAYFERQRQATAEADRPQVQKCAVCLSLLQNESDIGGLCAADGCDLPICVACWHTREIRHCPAHRPSSADQLAHAQAQLAAGQITLLVTAAEARQREQAFIARFDRKVHRIAKLRHPVYNYVYRTSLPWKDLHTYTDESGLLMELMRTGYLQQDVERVMPLNAASRYVIPGRGPEKPGLIMEARVLSHLPILVRQGFDTRRASLADLLRVLEQAVEAAETQDVGYLAGIASTTGWAAEARAYVEAGDAGTCFSHRLVLPLLVDLHEMTLVYDSADPRLAPLASLFAPYLPEEQMGAVVEHIRRELLLYSSLSLAEIVDQMEVSLEVVQVAAERLAATGSFWVTDVEGVGRVIAVTPA